MNNAPALAKETVRRARPPSPRRRTTRAPSAGSMPASARQPSPLASPSSSTAHQSAPTGSSMKPLDNKNICTKSNIPMASSTAVPGPPQSSGVRIRIRCHTRPAHTWHGAARLRKKRSDETASRLDLGHRPGTGEPSARPCAARRRSEPAPATPDGRWVAMLPVSRDQPATG